MTSGNEDLELAEAALRDATWKYMQPGPYVRWFFRSRELPVPVLTLHHRIKLSTCTVYSLDTINKIFKGEDYE
jgi:hypothetical protein